MRSITLDADERLIARASEEAHERKVTLNELFQRWLDDLASNRERNQQVAALLGRLEHVNAGGKFSRETLNER